ncbi:ankyrin repeat-containing domain protein [Neocallimastix lanati (nom. inval.)]|nr:ankyrin repeat-containing domain protein [Neocallimastix sp. JGI-2020a]
MNNNINNIDILLKTYNEKKLTPKILENLINNNHHDLYISSSLIKLLIKENEIELLNIIFDNLKFYDNDFIKWLLLLYKNKNYISPNNLNQKISKKEYKIIIDHKKENMNKNLIYYLIEHGVDINNKKMFKETPLFYACRRRNKDLVEYLVERGADINKENKDGETVLFIACKRGNKNLTEYFVEHGADINKENKDGESVLFNACKSENKYLIEYLLEHGADINKESGYGETVLFNACFSGNENLVEYLLDHGADINKQNKDGESVLFNACRSGNKDLYNTWWNMEQI